MTQTHKLLWLAALAAGLVAASLVARSEGTNSNAFSIPGATLTGVVRGMDEEAKVVHQIENARTYDFRVFVAFQYAMAAISTNESGTNGFYSRQQNVDAMNANVVTELRRAMLCQDAPKWVKDMRPYTILWSTNVLDPGQYPWHWEPHTGTNGPGIDWSKVDERDIP